MADLKNFGAAAPDSCIKPCSCGCFCCCICVIGMDSIGSVVVTVGAEAIISTGSFLMPKPTQPMPY
ncbi:MAG TPA: hypothetical protein VMX58_10695 [Patescibacteria group bacterium]|nr:hypothetical protein [Patescibacteria group bacterium]